MKDIVHVHVHEISGEISGYMSASLCQHQALDQLSVFCALIHWSEELSMSIHIDGIVSIRVSF